MFCSYKGSLTREHVWPEQLKNVFNVVGLAKHQKGDKLGRTPLRTWDAAPFSTRIRLDCATCNNEHLRTIEVDAMPYIVPMATGRADGGIPLDGQRKVAAFGFRMFAVGQYTHPEARPIPRAHREHLVQHHSPPLRTEIWLWNIAFDPDLLEPTIHCVAMPIADVGERLTSEPNAYHGLLRIGSLIIEVASRTDGRPYPLLPRASNRFIRIWPMDDFTRVVIWPPAALTEGEWLARLDGL